MRKTKEIRNNKGITMVSLIITIVVMLIIASTTVFVSFDRFQSNNLDKMYNDIQLLSDKVKNYYLKYNGLPIARDESNNPIVYDYTTFEFTKNINDNDNYYVLDLSAMEGISLNYGEEGFNKPNSSDDVYIINEKSHQIYYVRGIEVEDTTYYTIPSNESVLIDNIPPTKPQIKIISGTQNDKGVYVTDVKIEIIPGKDNWSEVDKTTYSVNGGEEQDITTTLQDNIYTITESGNYTIVAKSYDKNGNVSEKKVDITTQDKIKVGDYVNYTYDNADNYNLESKKSGYFSDTSATTLASDQSIQQEKGLKWKVLKIDESKNTIMLISENPVGEEIYFGGYVGYNNGSIILNNICQMHYSNSEFSVTASNISLEDLISCNAITEGTIEEITYKDKWSRGSFVNKNPFYPLRYKDATIGIQEVTITTGSNYTDNTYEESGDEGVTIQQKEYIKNDNESASIIFNGEYWLSSLHEGNDTVHGYGTFNLLFVDTSTSIHTVSGAALCSTNYYRWKECKKIRPVVELPANINYTKDDNGVWQINQ